MGIIKKIFGKKEQTESEFKANVLKKATEHMSANSESAAHEEKSVTSAANKSSPAYEINDKVKKKNIRAVLLEIAERGEVGVMAASISDKTGISKVDTSTALRYLTNNKFAEAVNNPSGVKFYLTEVGKKYCLSKEFNCD